MILGMEIVSVSALTFPVIAFKANDVSIHKNVVELTLASPLGVPYFTGLRIISADGHRLIVKSAKKASTRKPWWKPPLFVSFISVDLDIEADGDVTLGEFKEKLLKALRQDTSRLGMAGIEYREAAAHINKCSSFAEIAGYVARL